MKNNSGNLMIKDIFQEAMVVLYEKAGQVILNWTTDETYLYSVSKDCSSKITAE